MMGFFGGLILVQLGLLNWHLLQAKADGFFSGVKLLQTHKKLNLSKDCNGNGKHANLSKTFQLELSYRGLKNSTYEL